MSRWLVIANNFDKEYESIEIDKPNESDTDITNRLQNMFNKLEDIAKEYKNYKFSKEDKGDKYIITIWLLDPQGHPYKEDEIGTMSRLKSLLDRYKISYREI